MSSLEWRREQPRADRPGRDRVLWWMDVYVIVHVLAVSLTYAGLFVIDGWVPGLLVSLGGGWVFVRFYPSGGML